MNSNLKFIILLACLTWNIPFHALAQKESIDLASAIDSALQNNLGLKSAQQRVEATKAMIPAGFNLDKTQVFYRHDQNDIAENGYSNKVFGISQSMQFPTVYGSQRKVYEDLGMVEQQQYLLTQNQIIKEVSQTYYTIVYLQKLENNYRFLDSLYQQFSIAASRRYELGETNYLEKLTARSKMRELSVRLLQTTESKNQAYVRLEQLIQVGREFEIPDQELLPLLTQNWELENHPGVQFYQQSINLKTDNLSLERQRLLPDLNGEFFRGTNTGPNARIYPGVQVGVSIPLWFGAQKAKINSSKFELLQTNLAAENYSFQLRNRRVQLEIELQKFQEAISFYTQEGQQLSKQLIAQGNQAYKGGEIDFFQYVLLIENSRNIEVDYLTNLQEYNMTVLEINYLINP
ncbi:TolC family protein [Aquiflexum gelatinilyticum]|uniref:TolC family protein n=1 Tax=Aquiflexum gelatinilyticum TaxID=2961943 RepID=UPI0021671E64|nr:TolC family protein [Aquiflexum gelatinilyticum]MCS4436474.1 TolC family protein [Aquiflexum gelatinilyticum]